MPGTFPDHFSAVATAYAAARPTYPATLVDWLAAASPRRQRAWDVGCGNGQLSGLLATRFDDVIATDASAAQIAAAAPLAGVTFAVAPAEASGLPAGSADLVVAAQAAHWFVLPTFLAEARRVGRAGGLLALVCYGHAQLADRGIRAVLDRFAHDVAGPYWPPERALVDRGYRDLDLALPPVAAPALAITRAWTLGELAAYVGTWSATSALRRAVGDAPWHELQAALAAAWGRADERREVRWPISIVAGRLG